MKKKPRLCRAAALAALVCLLAALLVPAHAAQTFDVGNAYINYVLNSAAELEGKTGEELGFAPSWSGYFIRHIAERGGIEKIFPSMAECATGARILKYMPSAGGSSTVFWDDMTDVIGTQGVRTATAASFSPRPGDIAVLRTSYDSAGKECISRASHVGVVCRVTETDIYLISGNWMGKVAVGTRFSRTGTTEYDSYYYSVAGYARPDYPYTVAELGIRYDANGGGIEGQDHVISYYRIITPNGLNMRQGPNTGYAVVITVPRGTEFVVEETAESSTYVWGKTTVGTSEGWLVISRADWTERYALDATPYYLDSDGIVHERLSEAPRVDGMYCGYEYPDGVVSAEDLGITRPGYTFMGWSLTSAGTADVLPHTSLQPEKIYPDLINGSHELTLYAVWKKAVRSPAEADAPAAEADAPVVEAPVAEAPALPAAKAETTAEAAKNAPAEDRRASNTAAVASVCAVAAAAAGCTALCVHRKKKEKTRT